MGERSLFITHRVIAEGKQGGVSLSGSIGVVTIDANRVPALRPRLHLDIQLAFPSPIH
jgi:hypothetical protein